ncbi:MAG: Asp23/Gls24 family envelope stress response protein [Thermoactinomycetaceae bacterium]|nr:Asp23/Gls24 family envelope stress response protein [Bacillota bacterium]MBO2533278.1 Asp23/Gls24 family envelope stress response protein [Thermoactinomycetaceae bacterium]
MADKNQRGGLRFSTEVLETIAGIAASEVDGILSMSGGIVEGFAERLGRKNLTKGVTVELGETEVAVDLKVVVEYGRNVPEIYDQVVKNVERAITNMTGLKVVEVNMYVEGVGFPDENTLKEKDGDKEAPRIR